MVCSWLGSFGRTVSFSGWVMMKKLLNMLVVVVLALWVKIEGRAFFAVIDPNSAAAN